MAGAAVPVADRGAAEGGGAKADVEALTKAEEGRVDAADPVAATASAAHAAVTDAITWHDCVAESCLGLQAAYALDGRHATYRFSIAGKPCVVTLGSALAAGTFGVVKQTSDARVVAKQMKFPRGELLTRHRVDVLRNEMHMMERCGQIYAWATPPKGTLTLLMPNFGPYDLFDFLQDRGTLNSSEFFMLTVAVLRAFVTMQNQAVYGWPVVHRDIKPENIVVDPTVGTQGRRRGNILSVKATVVDVAFAIAADEQWHGNGAFFTYSDLTWGIGTAGIVPTPRIGRLISERRLERSYGIFWRCCEDVLRSEGGTKAFSASPQRLVNAAGIAQYAPQTNYCASTDLYAIGVLLGDMQSYTTRHFQRKIRPFLDFMARACSMRCPIPAAWVLAAAQTTQADYVANHHITAETLAIYARYQAASERLAALANQRVTTLTGAERAALEANIAALYASPLTVSAPAAAEAELGSRGTAAIAKEDDGISLAPMGDSAETLTDDASTQLLTASPSSYGTPRGGRSGITRQRCSPCCISFGRFMLWAGALTSTAFTLVGALGLAGAAADLPNEDLDTIFTGSGAGALVLFSCGLYCGACTTPARDKEATWY